MTRDIGLSELEMSLVVAMNREALLKMELKILKRIMIIF